MKDQFENMSEDVNCSRKLDYKYRPKINDQEKRRLELLQNQKRSLLM